MPPAQRVLDHWFGARPIGPAAIKQRSLLWFGRSEAPELRPQFDDQLRAEFGEWCRAAQAGEFAAWESSSRRRLALILLLDQFPRNIHRGTAAAFAGDAQALALSVGGMQAGMDATLEVPERLFFYMPLQHAESREVQEESVAAFQRLRAESGKPMRAFTDSAHQFAQRHRDVVQRFGRFPHRNAVLGRASSAEELEFLATGGERFGQ